MPPVGRSRDERGCPANDTPPRYRIAMSWRGVLKGVAMFVLILGSLIILWFGMVQMLFGKPWMRLGGLAMVVGGFRAIIFAFDLMWGRPPSFSKEPWDRPWEESPRRPPRH